MDTMERNTTRYVNMSRGTHDEHHDYADEYGSKDAEDNMSTNIDDIDGTSPTSNSDVEYQNTMVRIRMRRLATLTIDRALNSRTWTQYYVTYKMYMERYADVMDRVTKYVQKRSDAIYRGGILHVYRKNAVEYHGHGVTLCHKRVTVYMYTCDVTKPRSVRVTTTYHDDERVTYEKCREWERTHTCAHGRMYAYTTPPAEYATGRRNSGVYWSTERPNDDVLNERDGTNVHGIFGVCTTQRAIRYTRHDCMLETNTTWATL